MGWMDEKVNIFKGMKEIEEHIKRRRTGSSSMIVIVILLRNGSHFLSNHFCFQLSFTTGYTTVMSVPCYKTHKGGFKDARKGH